ncbi:MAG: FAD-dependent oxidoreductase [Verrucomicrobiaceae bacterium]|nr:FAD-dependent oxidoreductase [Verrucomicrobiaceae bacterium]
MRHLLFLLAIIVHAELPVIDLSQDTAQHVIIAQGTAETYQGHPTTVLLPGGKTMFAVWTLGHGGTCGPMKRSDDGGKTWSDLLPTPENWTQAKNCPSIYRLTGPDGGARLMVFAGSGPDKQMQQSVSLDDGKTWSPMKSNGLVGVMPFTTVVPVEGGTKLVGLSNIRRKGDKDPRSNAVSQSESTDGGLTWSPWRVIVDDPKLKPCEPALIRSPDGKQLLCLIRENVRSADAHFITSDDEGKTWSALQPLPEGLWGDRHMPHYGRDGRLVVTFRDMGPDKRTHNHFVAWVGTYDDIVQHRGGQRKLLLLRSYKGSDCGYSGLELLPDDTFVATTYIQYREGAEKNSVVSTRFTLAETDKAKPIATTAAPESSDGILTLDDGNARYVGDWVESTKQQPLIGAGYRHDNNRDQGAKSATFVATIIDEGEYEVRLLYIATTNRATNVPVAIQAADGGHAVTINQREECIVDGLPRALGVFKFAAGKEAKVTISNKDTNGFVVVDGLQLVPAAIAKAERAGERKSSHDWVSKAKADNDKPKGNPMATAVALSPLAKKTAKTVKKPDMEEIHLAKDASASDVNGKHYDLVVVGGTASGVACAVTAAREGLSVLLVQHNRHIGGMLSNGLMQWDALYGGPRSPLFTELLGNIEKHYIEFFGEDSKEHQIARCTHEHYPISWVEPHVMERECNRLVANEKSLTLLLSHYANEVQRAGAQLRSVTLRAYGTTNDIRVNADSFADATYEGDLFALAKVPYRVGREARDEYDEPHAGKAFVNIAHGPPPNLDSTKVNIRAYGSHQGTVDETSPFTADGAVQAYNMRFCVTNDPANRVMPKKPANYNREEFAAFDRKSIATNGGPNGKSHMNSPILPGENHAYPEASWPEREKIIARHRDFGLGLMWFLQHDESVPEKQRANFLQWGLAKDEFTDNDHIPYEMYVREARRIVGRHVFKEQDNSLAKDYARTPIMPDSIAITDWYMDSHSCTTDSRFGFRYDGKLILTEESRPAQIPYRALLPQGVDNLLVPVCLSATHVAWGAVRLEPVWMQTGEAAGVAAALSRQHHTMPGKLDGEVLLRTLVERRQLVSFFNDIKVDADDPRIPAAEYFATKGFFADYDAKLDEPLDSGTAGAWCTGLDDLALKKLNPTELAARIAKLVPRDAAPTTGAEFAALLKQMKWPVRTEIEALKLPADQPLARGVALEAMCRLYARKN